MESKRYQTQAVAMSEAVARDRSLEVTRDELEAILLPRYAEGHTRALAQAEYLRSIASDPIFGHDAYRALNALRHCGSYLEFQADQDDESACRLISAHLCKQYKLCPLCAMRRCGRGMAKYSEAIANVVADCDLAGVRVLPVFTTLTIVNGPDLVERFEHLNASKAAFMQRRRNAAKGKQDPWLNSIIGGVTAIEVKRGSGSGMWHPHLHGIWLLEISPDDERLDGVIAREAGHRLRRHWQAVSDAFIIDVQAMNNEQRFSKAVTECFKYAAKFSTMPPDESWYCHMMTKGRRFLSSFGVLRGLGEPDADADLTREDVEWTRLFYQYQDAEGEPAYVLLSEERGLGDASSSVPA